MRVSESEYLVETLLPLIPPATRWVNLGSSSDGGLEQRPHQRRGLEAIADRGGRVLNVDLKAGATIDIVGDLFDRAVQDEVRARQPEVILLTNVLEHVPDPSPLASVVEDLLPVGGHIVCTVPNSYPYHPDPIDTLFRPDVAELAALFPTCEVVEGAVVRSGRFLGKREGPASLSRRLRSYARVVAARDPRRSVPYHLRHRYWVVEHYRVSCVLLRRTDSRR